MPAILTKKADQQWRPQDIYYFGNGPCEGRSLPWLMFNNHPHLRELFEQVVGKATGLSRQERALLDLSDFLRLSGKVNGKSRLHQYLEYYLGAGENLAPKKARLICPYCGQEPVRYFLFINRLSYGFVVDNDLISCKDCLPNAKYHGVRKYGSRGLAVKRFRFSAFEMSSKFLSADGQRAYWKSLEELYKKIFGLPEILDDEICFNFFR